jgi:hypothetical protein
MEKEHQFQAGPGPPMKRKIQDQRAEIETQARKLARSGKYHGFEPIETILLAQGFKQVHKVFANRWTRFELDRLCKLAQICKGERSHGSGSGNLR